MMEWAAAVPLPDRDLNRKCRNLETSLTRQEENLVLRATEVERMDGAKELQSTDQLR